MLTAINTNRGDEPRDIVLLRLQIPKWQRGAQKLLKKAGKKFLEHSSNQGYTKKRLFFSPKSFIWSSKRTDSIVAQVVAGIINRRIELGLDSDVDLQDREDVTALMYAACNCYVEVVKVLLSKGAKIDTTNKKGETALILAFKAMGREQVEGEKSMEVHF